jgi:hypothetical protein
MRTRWRFGVSEPPATVVRESASTAATRIYFGHHKCMTSWINRVLGRVCAEMGWRFVQVFDTHVSGLDPVACAATRPDFMTYTDPEPDDVARLGPFVGFHVIRDPRDVVVSAYFSHLNSHPTENWPALEAHRERLRAVSKDDGLLLEMDFRADQFRQMLDWNYDQPNVLELKMEDITADLYDGMAKALLFVGAAAAGVTLKRRVASAVVGSARIGRTKQIYSNIVSLAPSATPAAMPIEQLLPIIYEHRFSAFAEGRGRGEEDASSHYRKGLAGDWRNHFTDRHVAHFKARYNDLLIKTGYGKSLDW